MGANYLLGGEEQEGRNMLLLGRGKKNKQHLPVFVSEKKNQSRANHLSSQTFMKFVFHVKFNCLALEKSQTGVGSEQRRQRLQCVVCDAVISFCSGSTVGKIKKPTTTCAPLWPQLHPAE